MAQTVKITKTKRTWSMTHKPKYNKDGTVKPQKQRKTIVLKKKRTKIKKRKK